MMQRALNLLLAAVVLVTPALAQRGIRGGMRTTSSRPFSLPLGHRPLFPAGAYLGTPFWGDDLASQSGQTSPVLVIQTQLESAQKALAASVEEPRSAAPLMIELQGDRYVRRSADTPSSTSNQRDAIASSSPPLLARPRLQAPKPTPTDQAPTVLIFRDGHREESSDYTIIAGVIYTRGNYWTTGSWSKKVLIADLNIPATLQANQERGVNFRLPSASNEVITRP
jgi:hypothetical protein